MQTLEEQIQQAIAIAVKYGGVKGDHHKAWVIDQMVRLLTGCPVVEKNAIGCNGQPYTYRAQGESQAYLAVVESAKAGEDGDGPETYGWDIGIAP